MTDNDFNPVVELQAEVQASPTLEIHAQVEMGSVASEYNAEAWAVGERHGVPVDENDQTYHNNSKWYAEQAADSADAAADAQDAAETAQAGAAQKEQQAAVHETAAQAAQAAAEEAAQEAIDTVVAAQGPGIVYMTQDGKFFVLDDYE